MTEQSGTTAPSRFRRRLTAAFVLVAAVSSGVLAVITVMRTHDLRWRSFHGVAQAKAELTLALAPSVLDEDSFSRLHSAYATDISTGMIAVAGDHAYLSSEGIGLDDIPVGQLRAGPGQGLASAMTRIGDREHLVVTGTGPGEIRYYFFFTTEPLKASLADLRGTVLIGWLVTVAVAAGVGNLVARRTLRPVRAAAEASTALAAGMLETRLDTSGGDEFGAWAAAFNRMADALADKMGALAAAAERERRFTSDVAHELRTPLTALAATAALLEDSLGDLPESARPAASLLVRQARRLRDLVLELLELSRLDGGIEPVRLEPIRLRDAIDAVLASLGDEVNTPVVLDVEAEVAVVADRVRLRRILANLLSNALVHGDGRVEVTTTGADGNGGLVAVDVADRGPGIAVEDLDHVFDRFFKSDTSRASDGTGLGLAIADQHARALGFPLSVRNRSGGGAVFTLRLRAAGSPPASGEAALRVTHQVAPAEGRVPDRPRGGS